MKAVSHGTMGVLVGWGSMDLGIIFELFLASGNVGLLGLEHCSGWQFAWFAGERENGREMNIFVISLNLEDIAM